MPPQYSDGFNSTEKYYWYKLCCTRKIRLTRDVGSQRDIGSQGQSGDVCDEDNNTLCLPDGVNSAPTELVQCIHGNNNFLEIMGYNVCRNRSCCLPTLLNQYTVVSQYLTPVRVQISYGHFASPWILVYYTVVLQNIGTLLVLESTTVTTSVRVSGFLVGCHKVQCQFLHMK